MYIIVVCGYEGLSAVLWAGEDKDEAVARVKGARHKVGRLSKIRSKYDQWPEESDDWESLSQEAQKAIFDEYDKKKDRYYKILKQWPMPWRHLGVMGQEDDTDRVCVMEMQEEWGFECVCGELEASPSKSWYY